MPTPLHKLADIRVAAECCIIAGNQILLQKRPMDAANFPGFWTLPGGHIDEKEDALTAIIREVAEETGITVTPAQVKLKVSAMNHHVDKHQVWVIFGFRVALDKVVPPVSSAEGECRWFSLSDLKNIDDLFPPIAIYLEHIIKDNAELLYISGDWQNAELMQQHTWVVDADS